MNRGIRTGFLPGDEIRQESCFWLEQKAQEKAVLAPLTIVKNAGFHKTFGVFGV